MAAPTLPVWVLTGFLGSGKTTLLNRLLRAPELGDTAVLVNELGAIPVDHVLVADAKERVVVLPSGCVCCSVRGDLVEVLGGLYAKAARGEIPPFRRVVVETTGLADPTPVLATFHGHSLLRRGYHLAGLLTTVDAALGRETLARHPEARKQVLLADRLVLTKTDAVEEAAAAEVEAAVRAMQPGASLLRASHGEVDAAALLAPVVPRTRTELEGFLAAPSPVHAHHHGDVRSFALTLPGRLDYGAFALWLSFLTQMHGEHVLRVKGILHVTDDEAPVVVQAVQHVVYPAATLARWPDDERASRVVVILRGADEVLVDGLRRSLAGLAPGAAGGA